jgi:hypothetical protein
VASQRGSFDGCEEERRGKKRKDRSKMGDEEKRMDEEVIG